MKKPTNDDTLEAAKDWLRENVEEGTDCPCCGQTAKVYRRKIHAGMARALITIYRLLVGDTAYIEVAEHLPHEQIADWAKLRYWNLIEGAEGHRDDGSDRVGLWRLTSEGRDFVEGLCLVPKYARVFDGQLLGLLRGDTVGIRDALGKDFSYRELMAGV